jgi:acetylornithine deacetylase
MLNIEQQILENIDAEDMLRFIKVLVETPSYGGNETEAQILVANKLNELGFEVDSWEIDFNELRKHPKFSMSFDRKKGLGVVGSFGDGDKSIIICGHIDTVAPGEEKFWKNPPLKATVEDKQLYGRGVTDMKGGLACGLYALKAIKDAGIKPNGKVYFASVIGEEDGGCGALATCLRGYRADAGIIMEPTETKIAPEVAGAISWKITVEGKSTHACVREEGISAIEKSITIINGLKDLEKIRNSRVNNKLYKRYQTPFALNIGKIYGGEWPGSVPEKVLIEGRLGVAIGETKEQAKKEMEKYLQKISGKDTWLRNNPPVLEWVGYSFGPSKIPVDHPIVKNLKDSFRKVTGEEPELEGMTYASDARLLIEVGKTPTVVFGPGDVRDAHGPNECVSIKDLEIVTKTIALTVLNFLGY